MQEVGPKDFHETLGFFYEKASASPFREKFFGVLDALGEKETLPKKTWGMHFSVTPS